MSDRALLVLLLVSVSLAASNGRTYGVAVDRPDHLQPLAASMVANTPHRQLLQSSSFIGGTLSVEGVKEKARKVARRGQDVEWTEQNATIIVPSGEGRMLILESPPTAKFKVVLSATPRTHLSSGGPPPFLPDPISQWPTEDQCNGNGLLAAAFRQDRVPTNVSRLASPAIMFVRKRKLSGSDKDLLTLLAYECNPQSSGNNKTRDDRRQQKQERVFNSTYNLSEGTLEVLRYLNIHAPHHKEANRMVEGYQQLVGWPIPSQVAPTPSALNLGKNATLAHCTRQLQELRTRPNITLPGLYGNESRTECAEAVRSKIVVYVHNCFTHTEADMLVHVTLEVVEDREGVCESNLVWTVQIMCVVAMVMMGVVVVVCILPALCVAAYQKCCRMHEKHKRAQAKKERKAHGASPSQCQDKHAQVDDDASTAPDDRDSDVPGWYKMFHDTISHLNNPSGYSRLYTVTVTTSAALLVAAIVWAPAISPSAVHDNAFGDIIIIPRKGHDTWTPDALGGYLQDAEYYFKVMGLSALMGHTVKLALLSNLSPPAPGSKGVVVNPAVWWRQVVLSVLGLLLLAFVIGSYTMSFFVLRSSLQILEAHMYLLVVMLANFGAAIGFYIHYTFRHRPPLTSEAANHAARHSKPPPQPPSSLSSLKVTASKIFSRKRSVKQSRSLSDDASPAGIAAHDSSEKDTTAGPDQTADSADGAAVVAGPGKGEGKGAGSEAKLSVGQRISSLGGRLAAKIRGDIWEDENFRYSSWVLTPVWLTLLLMMFWWLTGVCRAGLIVDCLQDPATCSGGVLPFTTPVSEVQMQAQDLLSSGKEAARYAQASAVLMNQAVAKAESTVRMASQGLNGSLPLQLTLLKEINKIDTMLDNSVKEAEEAARNMTNMEDQGRKILADAEHVGRWLGYTTAVFFAFVSLYQIVKTFKRVLLFKAYMHKTLSEQDEMVDVLESRQSTSARMLARVMSTMRQTSSHSDIGEPSVPVQDAGGSTNPLSAFELAAASSSTVRVRRVFSRSPTLIMPVPENRAASGKPFHAVQLPSRNISPSGKELGTQLPRTTGSSGSNRSFKRTSSIHAQDGVALTSGLRIKEERENSLCVSIAQDIQRLEADMARFHAGKGLFDRRLVGLVGFVTNFALSYAPAAKPAIKGATATKGGQGYAGLVEYGLVVL